MSNTEVRVSFKCGRASRWLAFVVVVCAASVVAGCRRDMQDQPKYEIYERSEYFNDKQTQRPIPENTVPRGYLREDDHLYTGRIPGGGGVASASQTIPASPTGATTSTQVANREDGGAAGDLVASPGAAAAQFDADLAQTFPFPVTREVIDRGEERFRAFCVMCHGLTGEGDGMVVRRGFKRPTSYHDDRLRGAPVGHFFDVITNGYGVMPNYAAQVTPRDRWAIAAYIRALQLSRAGSIEDVPEEERGRLTEAMNGIRVEGAEQQQQQSGEGGNRR